MTQNHIVRIIACTLFLLLGGSTPRQLAYAQEDSAKAKAKEYYLLGNQYYQQGKFVEAQEQYQKAIKLLDKGKAAGTKSAPTQTMPYPANPFAASSGALQEEYASTLNNDSLLDYTIRGNKYYDQGKYKEAQEEYQKAIKAVKGERILNTQAPAGPSGNIASLPPLLKYPNPNQYIIGTEDILSLFVWQNPDLSQDTPIRPDGNASFPLIGEMRAAGLSIPDLTKNVTEKLKEYLKNPLVTISVRTYWGQVSKRPGEQKVVILGEVAQPGVYYVSGARTVLEAIGQSGGFTRDAVPSSTILIRGGPMKPNAIRLNLNRTLTKGDVTQNVMLQAEDTIFVPKKFIADLNYFLLQLLGTVTNSKTLEHAVQGGAASW